MREAVLFLLTSLSVWAQAWTPSKIVAITEYPKIARLVRVAGTVEVRCTLDSSGNVTAAELLSGTGMLGTAARENALQWRFQKASKEVSDNSVTLTYIFLLEGKPQGTTTTFVFELPNKVQVVAPINFITGAP